MTKIVRILFRENTTDVVISYHICLSEKPVIPKSSYFLGFFTDFLITQ